MLFFPKTDSIRAAIEFDSQRHALDFFFGLPVYVEAYMPQDRVVALCHEDDQQVVLRILRLIENHSHQVTKKNVDTYWIRRS